MVLLNIYHRCRHYLSFRSSCGSLLCKCRLHGCITSPKSATRMGAVLGSRSDIEQLHEELGGYSTPPVSDIGEERIPHFTFAFRKNIKSTLHCQGQWYHHWKIAVACNPSFETQQAPPKQQQRRTLRLKAMQPLPAQRVY